MALMTGNTFLALRDAEKKRKDNKPLSAQEAALLQKYASLTQKKLCGCGCGKELEPRVDGEHYTMGDKEINTDCYFDKLEEVVEKFPILPPRLRRRS